MQAQYLSKPLPGVSIGFGSHLTLRCRYLDNMTSERVDAEGVSNIAQAAKHFLPQRSFQPETQSVISMRNKEDLEAWEKLDDTIMGGKSGSFLQVGVMPSHRVVPGPRWAPAHGRPCCLPDSESLQASRCSFDLSKLHVCQRGCGHSLAVCLALRSCGNGCFCNQNHRQCCLSCCGDIICTFDSDFLVSMMML